MRGATTVFAEAGVGRTARATDAAKGRVQEADRGVRVFWRRGGLRRPWGARRVRKCVRGRAAGVKKLSTACDHDEATV